jgi:HlyD family secretion protein
VLGLAVAGAIYALWPQPVEVDVAEVTIGPLQVTVNEDGMTRVKERYTVSSPVGGQLVRITLDPGDEIKAGTTLLATIQPSDPSMLDARQVAETEARVAAAQKMIERASGITQQALATKEVADSQFARSHELWEQDAISEHEYDQVVADARVAAEALRTAQFDEEIAEFELQQAQAALIRVKPSADSSPPSQFEIHSPIDGIVLRVFQESAAVVIAGTPLVEVGNRHDMEIVIDVLTTDAVKIDPGDEVLLEHWGGDRTLQAKVRRIEPAAFTKISALGVEEQRVNVIADFAEELPANSVIGDGFRVEARIVVWRNEKTKKIPSSALFRSGDDWYVYVDEGDIARKKRVTIGRRSDFESEILDGLAEGQRVVLYPSDQVADGASLVPRAN